ASHTACRFHLQWPQRRRTGGFLHQATDLLYTHFFCELRVLGRDQPSGIAVLVIPARASHACATAVAIVIETVAVSEEQVVTELVREGPRSTRSAPGAVR